MKTYFEPGDSLTLYNEPFLGRFYMWARQFPKTVVCVCFFALGMVFCRVFQPTQKPGSAKADALSAISPAQPTTETSLAIAPPLLEILKPSKPYLFDGFVPADGEERAVLKYVERFAPVAIGEMERFGIPASIKLAQGIIESNSGRSELSRKANNHFGVKCFSRSCKKGHCTNFGDDSHKDFFRKYGSAWESWRAHSKMIVSGKYKALLKEGNDFEAWASGLKKLGYATAKDYDLTLVNLIKKYHLDDFDK